MNRRTMSLSRRSEENARYVRRPKNLNWMLLQATAIFREMIRSQSRSGTQSVRRFLAVSFVVGLAMSSRGTIEDLKQISIDFTNLATATNEATWSPPDNLTVTKDGLGWDGEGASVRDGWIQTKPLALGLSWRPPFAVNVRVSIQPPPVEITLNDGQKYKPYGGDVYVRYSPDRKHWSSWQALQSTEAQLPEEKKTPGRYFSGAVRVPYRERERYGELLSDYSRLDVPWKSDEEAVVRWILERDGDFFSRQIPFIGYIQFMFESSLYGGQRIRSLRAQVAYGMSGIHSPPKDESVRKEREGAPWRFDANEK
jgi:hypothetical protein